MMSTLRLPVLFRIFLLGLAIHPAAHGAPGETNPACVGFEDAFYDSIYQHIEEKKRLPTEAEIRTALEPLFKVDLREDIAELFKLIGIEGVQALANSPKDVNSLLEAVASIEMGDRSSSMRKKIQAQIRPRFDTVQMRISSDLRGDLRNDAKGDFNCLVADSTVERETGPLLSYWQKVHPPAVYGALKTFAVAYQSCEVGSLEALKNDTPDVKGIKVTGVHPDGIGNRRIIDDLQALLTTHPYLSHYQKPAMSCFDVRTQPMIYDYGGKPSTSSGTLNLFTNAGTGTSVLGVDCSGYVYSALAAAGLKLKKSGRLKAAGVHGVRAKQWMDPQQNGLTCFDHVRFSALENLKPGDILASSGHVVLIDSVGPDPFGIENLKQESECKVENMSAVRFAFTILQSSPSKAGIGLNRFRAADYFADGSAMGEALLQHAVNACLAKTKGGTIKSLATKAGLVRHLGSAQCRDKAIAIDRQTCLGSCPAPPAR